MTEPSREQFEAVLEAVAGSRSDFLSPIGPLIMTAAALGVAADSRRFARIFEVAHALVIRECNHLSDELGLIVTHRRREQSQRIDYRLTDEGRSLLETGDKPEIDRSVRERRRPVE